MFQRKVINYKILGEEKSDELEEEVFLHLKNGWELYGFPYWTGSYHRQALVLYDDSVNGDENDSE